MSQHWGPEIPPPLLVKPLLPPFPLLRSCIQTVLCPRSSVKRASNNSFSTCLSQVQFVLWQYLVSFQFYEMAVLRKNGRMKNTDEHWSEVSGARIVICFVFFKLPLRTDPYRFPFEHQIEQLKKLEQMNSFLPQCDWSITIVFISILLRWRIITGICPDYKENCLT